MNIPPSEAAALDLWTYEAMLFKWNEAHSTSRDDVDPPDAGEAMRVLEMANADPRLTH